MERISKTTIQEHNRKLFNGEINISKNVTPELVKQLERELTEILTYSQANAKKDNRKTIMTKDIQVGIKNYRASYSLDILPQVEEAMTSFFKDIKEKQGKLHEDKRIHTETNK